LFSLENVPVLGCEGKLDGCIPHVGTRFCDFLPVLVHMLRLLMTCFPLSFQYLIHLFTCVCQPLL